jgi:HEAT repeat protein
MTRTVCVSLCAFAVLCGTASAQQARYDDVVRNLRNPDPKVRFSAVRLLRESKYPEAAQPIAALVTDPIDQVQLEAIATELSFFMVEEVPAKKRVGLLVEVRTPALAEAAFDSGPLAVWPRAVPPELVHALLDAIDDHTQKVRVEAIYTLGTIARPPLAADAAAQLIKALDHYDPVIRAAAARVVGRLQVNNAGDALIKAMNDSNSAVCYAAMRALGDLHEQRAVKALADQLAFYGKGEGAAASLDALAKIADPSSVPLFKARLADKDPVLRQAAAEGLGRVGDKSEVSALQTGAGNDSSAAVRAAMAFALQKVGYTYVARLVDFMTSEKIAPQIAGYLLELGPSIVPSLLSHLQDPSPAIRANVAEVLGALGSPAAESALQPITQDKDRQVAEAATRSLQQLKMSRP